MAEVYVPVLIVGAGPAGLTTALALSRYGVEAMLLERHATTAHTPRAHIVNQRTVEIMRHLGLENQLKAVATPPELMRNTLWVTSLVGDEIARLESWGTGTERSAEYQSSSPSPMLNCPQTMFEPVLMDAVRQTGCAVRTEHEFVKFEQDGAGVISTVLDRATGETYEVRSDYLIGADGARSRVFEQAGLEITGPAGTADHLNIWFRADLSPYLAHRPGVLTWNVAPGPLPSTRLGTLICHRPFSEFVLVVQYDAAKEAVASWSTEELVRRVHAFVGDSTVDVEILGSAGWQVNAQVATEYSSERVFCMGDAVHRHPPTNGLGLNLSVADGFNLAWKIALVLSGVADAALLNSYSDERQPVGARCVQRAITSRGEVAAVSTSLGYVPGQSVEEGQRLLDQLWASGAEGTARRDSLSRAIAQTQHQFNAHGIELGYRYESAAVIGDEEADTAPNPDPELFYQPTSRAGARLPHARLGIGQAEVSTLDLVSGVRFTLFTGIGGGAWAAAAQEVGSALGIAVDVFEIGAADGPRDLYGDWAHRREIDEDGCVLVRPDRHVAWRQRLLPTDPAGSLRSVLSQILLGASNQQGVKVAADGG